MRARTIEGLNAFALTRCSEKVHVTDGQNTRDQITRVEVETRVIKFRFVHSIHS